MFSNKPSKRYCVISETEIMIGMYCDDGSCISEMKVEWEVIRNKLVPRLKIFDDAWDVLYKFKPLLKTLSKYTDKNISQQQFISILQQHNFSELKY